MKRSILERDPQIRGISMAGLVAIAGAIERESMQRYAQLARTMQRRGESETAEAFRTMLDEERAHAEAVESWAQGLGVSAPPSQGFEWQLPADLAGSWDEIAGSALLTPYRAYAVAVENEQRAFSFYAYLAAHAGDARVAKEAERLAAEELRHAGRVRAWRRAAWHREQPSRATRVPQVRTLADLQSLLAQREAAIAACHRAVAKRLREIGDEGSAHLLESLAAEVASRTADTAPVAAPEEIAAMRDPVHLLVVAQKPLEALGEALDSVLAEVEGELFARAEEAASDVVARIARVSLQIERRMHAPAG